MHTPFQKSYCFKISKTPTIINLTISPSPPPVFFPFYPNISPISRLTLPIRLFCPSPSPFSFPEPITPTTLFSPPFPSLPSPPLPFPSFPFPSPPTPPLPPRRLRPISKRNPNPRFETHLRSRRRRCRSCVCVSIWVRVCVCDGLKGNHHRRRRCGREDRHGQPRRKYRRGGKGGCVCGCWGGD